MQTNRICRSHLSGKHCHARLLLKRIKTAQAFSKKGLTVFHLMLVWQQQKSLKRQFEVCDVKAQCVISCNFEGMFGKLKRVSSFTRYEIGRSPSNLICWSHEPSWYFAHFRECKHDAGGLAWFYGNRAHVFLHWSFIMLANNRTRHVVSKNTRLVPFPPESVRQSSCCQTEPRQTRSPSR